MSDRKKQTPIGKLIVRKIDSIVNFVVLSVCILFLLYGGYSLWDDRQMYQAAESTNYTEYRPDEDGDLSFQELQKKNPDVFGWLTVYGTSIDYPLLQGEDNDKYINTDAEGNFSMAGSIFLDCRNKKDFSDFNSIIYGHHMEEDAMFGELDSFQEKKFFEEHRYGNLYYDGKDHGMEFFAFLETDAYDSLTYTPAVQGEDLQSAYLEHLFSEAVKKRETEVGTEDRIILLSTCNAEYTNGRYVLVGKLTRETFEEEKQG